MDSSLLVPRSSALLMVALPTLLPLLLLPPGFPPTMAVLLPPSLALPPRALQRYLPTPASAGLRRRGPPNALSPLVTFVDEVSTTNCHSLSLMCIIYHVPWYVFLNTLGLIFPLTRHSFRLPILARPSYIYSAFLLRRHMKRCAQVAPIHLLVKMPRNWIVKPRV